MTTKFNVGDICHVDTGNIPQYPERFVDDVTVLETPVKHSRYVLCYAKQHRANILVPKKDL